MSLTYHSAMRGILFTDQYHTLFCHILRYRTSKFTF